MSVLVKAQTLAEIISPIMEKLEEQNPYGKHCRGKALKECRDDDLRNKIQSEKLLHMLETLGIEEKPSKAELLLIDRDIQSAYESALECQACQKTSEEILNCYRFLVDYDRKNDRLHFSIARCARFNQARALLAQKEKADRLLKDVTISPRFKNRRFENFEPSSSTNDAFRFCKLWADNFSMESNGIFLYGNTGNGKTHLAAACLLQVHEDHLIPAIFDVMPVFFAKLKQSITDSKAYSNLLDTYMNVPLLVLDDIDKLAAPGGTLSAWARETLYILINHRYEFLLPTVFTSNTSPYKLRPIFGDAIISRIIDMATIIKNDGQDMRLLRNLNGME